MRLSSPSPRLTQGAFFAFVLCVGVFSSLSLQSQSSGSFGDDKPRRPMEELREGVFMVDGKKRTHLGTWRTPYWVLLPEKDKSEKAPVEAEATDFLGAQACAECHEKKFEGFSHTAHHRTSRLPSHESIHGSFDPGKNSYQSQFPYLYFEMTSNDEGFFQTAIIDRDEEQFVHTQPIDLVVGSGKMGQTFLYWIDDQLFELPITYFTELETWANSPGYRDGTAHFARPVISRCLECHTTFFQPLPGDHENHYNPEHFILGVSCERCHGPGRQHVEFHREYPDAEETKYIVHPADLSRERSIQLCAQCHSGGGMPKRPPFTYRPGEDLREHVRLAHAEVQNKAGVHTDNQLPRLMKSTCYQKSEMTCATCHDPHQHQRGNVQSFSERCQDCHNYTECGWEAELGPEIKKNCVECHVPLGRDSKTPIQVRNISLQPLLRDHFIAIYPEISAEVRERVFGK